MKRSHITWASLASLVLTASSLGAQSPSLPSGPTATPTRDPQAIGILTQVIASAGGSTAIAAIQDFTGSGTITFNWDEAQVQGTVIVKGRGLHEFRIDATLPDGVHSSVLNNTSTFQKQPDGSTSPLPSQNTIKIGSGTFPLLAVLTYVEDANFSVTDGGLVTRDNQQLHDIIVGKSFSATSDPLGVLSSITKAHVLVDPSTLTVQSIEDVAYAIGDVPRQYPHVMRFSSYQVSKGILTPLSITEFVAGQQTAAITLTQITFNNALSDADFN